MLTFEETWEAVARCHGGRITVMVSGPFGPVLGFDGTVADGEWLSSGRLMFTFGGDTAFVLDRAAFVEAEWRQEGFRLVIRERGGLVVEVDPVPAPVRRPRRLEIVS